MSETGVTLEREAVDVRDRLAVFRGHYASPALDDADDLIRRLLADNEAKAREIEYFKSEYQDTAGITQIKTERDFLAAEIARLKSRPTTEAGTAAPPADHDDAGQEGVRLADKILSEMDKELSGSQPSASGPDAVARAKAKDCLVWWPSGVVNAQTTIDVVASALVAAENRGAERERERNASLWPCAPNSKDPDDDKEWLAGFVAGINAFRVAIRARSQPDERGG